MVKRKKKKEEEENDDETGEEAIRRKLRALCAKKTTLEMKRQCLQEIKDKVDKWMEKRTEERGTNGGGGGGGGTMMMRGDGGRAQTECLTTGVARGVLEGALGGKKGVQALPGYRGGNARARYVYVCIRLGTSVNYNQVYETNRAVMWMDDAYHSCETRPMLTEDITYMYVCVCSSRRADACALFVEGVTFLE